jgi:polysaccharide deacetylase 2 family uncharacterized protein YibQ
MPLSRRILLAGLAATPAVAPSLFAAAADELPEGPAPDLSAATSSAGSPAPSVPAQAASALPPWQSNAIKPPVLDGRPAITIVVDDMGWVHPYTERAASLPGPLTLSWFPFAHHLADQIGAAMAFGHETTLHMPMQAHTNSIAQTGPDPLRIDLPPEVNLARLKTAMDAVPLSVGLNNHMGSVATKDAALMSLVAAETKRRGYLFLDSITVAHSVAESCAVAAGVPAAGRDIFIDWKMRPDIIATQLNAIEVMARRTGHVIAIGHPRPMTLEALAAWLPTLADKGFALWPLSAAIAWRNKVSFSTLHVA